MPFASPENEMQAQLAREADSIYESGWNDAIDAAIEAIRRKCPGLDENGYICTKSDAITALQNLKE